MDKFETAMAVAREAATVIERHTDGDLGMRLLNAVEAALKPPIIDLSEAAIRAHRIDDGWVIMEEVENALKAAGLTATEAGYDQYVAEAEYQDVIRGARRPAMVACGGAVLEERAFLDELAIKAGLNFPKCPSCGSMHCFRSGTATELHFESCKRENACKIEALSTLPPEGV